MNLPPDTTQGQADRAAWDEEDCARRDALDRMVQAGLDAGIYDTLPDEDDDDCCPSCGCTSPSQDRHYAHCPFAGATDEDLVGRYEPGCEVSAVINVGPLDVATMQAVLDSLKATLSDDERATVSAVITVEPK